ncbi:MAG: hypothetical protein AB2A00_38245 [Myxococcota bacterium]
MALLILGTACSTVQIKTEPADAKIVANGEDISEERSFREDVGGADHDVVVSKPGYRTRRIAVPRDRMGPFLKWGSFVGSLGCAFLSAGTGCCLIYTLNRDPVRVFVGGMLANGNNPLGGVIALLQLSALNTLTVGCLALPCMAAGTALCSWPLAGMLVNLIYPQAQDEVEIRLEREEAAP